MKTGTPNSLYEAIDMGLDRSANDPNLPADHDPVKVIHDFVMEKLAQYMAGGELQGKVTPAVLWEQIKKWEGKNET